MRRHAVAAVRDAVDLEAEVGCERDAFDSALHRGLVEDALQLQELCAESHDVAHRERRVDQEDQLQRAVLGEQTRRYYGDAVEVAVVLADVRDLAALQVHARKERAEAARAVAEPVCDDGEDLSILPGRHGLDARVPRLEIGREPVEQQRAYQGGRAGSRDDRVEHVVGSAVERSAERGGQSPPAGAVESGNRLVVDRVGVHRVERQDPCGRPSVEGVGRTAEARHPGERDVVGPVDQGGLSRGRIELEQADVAATAVAGPHPELVLLSVVEHRADLAEVAGLLTFDLERVAQEGLFAGLLIQAPDVAVVVGDDQLLARDLRGRRGHGLQPALDLLPRAGVVRVEGDPDGAVQRAHVVAQVAREVVQLRRDGPVALIEHVQRGHHAVDHVGAGDGDLVAVGIREAGADRGSAAVDAAADLHYREGLQSVQDARQDGAVEGGDGPLPVAGDGGREIVPAAASRGHYQHEKQSTDKRSANEVAAHGILPVRTYRRGRARP